MNCGLLMWTIWNRMKNKFSIPYLGVSFFLLTLLLALFSWIGSIYGVGEIQSLLDAEGIRWVLGHVVENYVQAPALGIVLLLFMGLGIFVRSGMYAVLKRVSQREKLLSRKERRALTLALGVLLVYIGCVLLALFLPWNFLLGVTGNWFHSPFSKGLVYILSIGIGLSGMVYGFVSDTFRSLTDVFQSMSWLIARKSSYFVALFFIVQFFASLEYTRLVDGLNIEGDIWEVVFHSFCFLPLFADYLIDVFVSSPK